LARQGLAIDRRVFGEQHEESAAFPGSRPPCLRRGARGVRQYAEHAGADGRAAGTARRSRGPVRRVRADRPRQAPS
jgi:hypothetical protein